MHGNHVRCVEILLGKRLTLKLLNFTAMHSVLNITSNHWTESGADPTMESDSGFNAMDMAVAMGHRNGN